ncbi:MAG TPA: bifunctional hydroxymethylpyrimidine kinase/phosphomethylpyrimidine kinase, partial [Verrucomicrobiae bacterium]|nr:bifunctional hydroxymethylpyrimidine kinase/phosphomethylpyrimidine kinase [Verrucomicrobiae bacterium]
FKDKAKPPLIVDPVMVATSGARLLQTSAVKAMRDKLLPLAALVTPNLDEAAILIGRNLVSVDDLRAAAREIKDCCGCAALVKGGHLKGMKEAVDVFYDGKTELLLTAPFVRGVSTHGTGCVYSAAVAGYLALGRDLSRAVQLAKQYITCAIAKSVVANGHSVLNSLGPREGGGMNGTGRTRLTARMR